MAATFVNFGTRITNIPNDGVTVRNLPAPASIVTGNLLLIEYGVFDHTTPNAPTGGGTWTRVTPGDTFPQNSRSSIDYWWKIATGSEPANYGVSCAGTSSNANTTAQVFQYTGNDTTTPINIAAINSVQTGVTTITPPNVTTTVAGCTIHVGTVEVNQHASTITANSPLTLAVNNSGSPIADAVAYNSAGVPAGVTTPGTLTASVSHDFISMTIGIAPLPVPSSALTGTITSATEADIVAGGKTIILTLTNDTWVASGGTFDGQRANIIAGMTSAGSETFGWNNVVKTLQSVTGVVRTSATVVTITLDAEATYNITASETITVTLPSTAVTSATSYAASPTFTITAVVSGFFRNNPSGQLSGLGSSGKFFQNPLQ